MSSACNQVQKAQFLYIFLGHMCDLKLSPLERMQTALQSLQRFA